MECKRAANTILKNKVRGLTVPNVKTFHKATVIRTMVLAKEQINRSMKQNREPRNRSAQIKSIDLWKEAGAIQWIKDRPFNRWCWKNWMSIGTKMSLDTHLTPFTKVNPKWIITRYLKLANSETERRILVTRG